MNTYTGPERRGIDRRMMFDACFGEGEFEERRVAGRRLGLAMEDDDDDDDPSASSARETQA